MNKPFIHGLTLREEGQVELWSGLTDLTRAILCSPWRDNVNSHFLAIAALECEMDQGITHRRRPANVSIREAIS